MDVSDVLSMGKRYLKILKSTQADSRFYKKEGAYTIFSKAASAIAPFFWLGIIVFLLVSFIESNRAENSFILNIVALVMIVVSVLSTIAICGKLITKVAENNRETEAKLAALEYVRQRAEADGIDVALMEEMEEIFFSTKRLKVASYADTQSTT